MRARSSGSAGSFGAFDAPGRRRSGHPCYNTAGMSDPNNVSEQLEQMQRRLDMLERENQRLREKLDPMLGPDNPCFHPQVFLKVMRRNLTIAMIPLWLVFLVVPLAMVPRSPLRSMTTLHIGQVPVFDLAGSSSGMPGIGFGIVAFGGLSVGVISVGGMAVGLVAFGGGAVGVFAFGGGSVGLIALGGGACGL